MIKSHGCKALLAVTTPVVAMLLTGCMNSAKPMDSDKKPMASFTTTPTGTGTETATANDTTEAVFNTLPTPAAPPPAPTVNVFGELNGVPRTPGKLVGDEGFQQHTFADEGYDADVTVDPTGKLMAFASTRHNEHAGIYVQKVDGTAVTKLTSDDSDNAFPTFSPDGRQIAYCSTRSGAWNIYMMDTDGRNVVTITSGPAQCVHPSFSPDGTQLVYSQLGARSNQWELWTFTLATGERRQIGYGLFPSWSPDKTVSKIAFQRARQRGSRWFSLWTLDLVDGDARHVSEIAVSSNAAIVGPSWSPTGKRLVFATILDPARGGKKNGGKGEQDIWTINADGSDRKRLTDGNGVNLAPYWGSDNRVYFVSNRGGTESVWSVKPQGSQIVTAGVQPTDPKRTEIGDTRDMDR